METKKIVKKPVIKVTASKPTVLEYIKKNWKNILLILLLVFSLSKCTSSCTRGRQIDKLNYQIVQMDSIIQANGIEMDKMSIRLNDIQESNNAYKGIATGNQKELINQIETLTEERTTLKEKVNKLNSENTKLKKQVSDLENKVEELEKKEIE